MRDDPSVIALVSRANDGDKTAWNELVARYAPLVWAICNRFRLDRPDADDVGQRVWLRLVEHLPALRDPAALPGWLVTTTRRECMRVLRASRDRELHEHPLPADTTDDGSAAIDRDLLAAERNDALRKAFAGLATRCRRLLAMLLEDPPRPYTQISAELGIPVASVGPNRARCIEALRRAPELAALIAAESMTRGST